MFDIVSDLKSFLFSMLKELKSKIDKNISNFFLFSVSNHIIVRVFYKELDSQLNNEIDEIILDAIYFYYQYKLNLEDILSKELIKEIKNYIGYNTELKMFNLDTLPKKIQNKIDKEMNNIFPIIDIRFLPDFLKVTMPHSANEI